MPEILAAIIIANHPTQYGFDDVTLDPPVLTDTVTINYSVDLRLVSDLVGAPVDEIEALNPSLLRMVTPPDTPFDLHCPPARPRSSSSASPSFPKPSATPGATIALSRATRWPRWRRSIASRPAELAAANQLSRTDSIAGVEALVVPVRAGRRALARTRLYTVRRGDTLVTIADRFGVSLSQLRRWNAIPPAPGRAGPPPARGRARPGAAQPRRIAAGLPQPALRPTLQPRRNSPPRRSQPISRRRQKDSMAPSPAPRTSMPAPPGLHRNSKKSPHAAFDACVLLVFVCKL